MLVGAVAVDVGVRVRWREHHAAFYVTGHDARYRAAPDAAVGLSPVAADCCVRRIIADSFSFRRVAGDRQAAGGGRFGVQVALLRVAVGPHEVCCPDRHGVTTTDHAARLVGHRHAAISAMAFTARRGNFKVVARASVRRGRSSSGEVSTTGRERHAYTSVSTIKRLFHRSLTTKTRLVAHQHRATIPAFWCTPINLTGFAADATVV